MRKEIRKIEVFIATDGREFNKENDCISYEKELRYKIKTDQLILNSLLIIPFLSFLSMYSNPLLPFNIIFYLALIFTGIVSILSIIALIYRKWKK